MLRDSYGFARFLKCGTRRNSTHFSVVYYVRERDTDADNSVMRLGIVASKKSYKLAVDRNKSKRRVRAMMTQLSKVIDISRMDILVIVRRGFAEADYAILKDSMHKLLSSCK